MGFRVQKNHDQHRKFLVDIHLGKNMAIKETWRGVWRSFSLSHFEENNFGVSMMDKIDREKHHRE